VQRALLPIGRAGKNITRLSCNDEEIDKIKELYFEDENYNLAFHSALVEAEGYCNQTRLEEIMNFGHKCGFKKLGVAFCLGLSKEANMLCKVLRHNSFEVESVICKNGSIPKEFLNINQNQKLKPNTFEPMCNPIGQAKLLNKAQTELNIILGLCVGHDSLFIKYSEAPVTVLQLKIESWPITLWEHCTCVTVIIKNDCLKTLILRNEDKYED
jgi:uncharacterized metal-binding protein